MAKAWKDVIASPQYQALSPEDKERAQNQYFDQVVAPRAGDRAEEARAQFFSAFPLRQAAPQQGIDPDEIPTHETGPFEPRPERSILDKLGTGAKAVGAIASGAIAEPLSGLVGAAYGDPSLVGKVQESLTYSPDDRRAQAALRDIAARVSPMAKDMQSAGQFLGDVGYNIGGPVGGAIGETIPTAIAEAVGGLAARPAARAAKVSGLPDDLSQQVRAAGGDPDVVSSVSTEAAKRSAEEVARARAFEAEGIPTLKSRITQDFGDFMAERRLLKDTGPEAKELRARESAEAAGFQEAVDRYKNAFGVPEESGDSIKAALREREKGLKADVTKAYRELDKATKGQSIPLLGNKITGAFDDPQFQAMAGRLSDSDRAKVNDILIEYGIDTNPDRVGDWISSREAQQGAIRTKAEVTPLSLSNFEDMRKAFNALSDPMAPKELQAVAGKLARAVDEELASFDKAVSSGGLSQGKDALAAARRARNVYKQLRDIQNTDKLVGRMIGNKPRTPDEDLILSSEISSRLLSGGKDGAIENVGKVIDTLKRNEQGIQAIGNLQADIAARLLTKGVSKQRLEGGVNAWNPQGFIDEFNRLNKDGRLAKIFETNPEGLEGLQRLAALSESKKAFAQVAKDSGTADNIINSVMGSVRGSVLGSVINMLGMTAGGPGAAVAVGAGQAAGSARKGRKVRAEARRALDMSPTDYNKTMQVKRMYPELYGALVAGSALPKEDDN